MAFLDGANQQAEWDMVRAEVVSFPPYCTADSDFRGVVAALAPLLIGGRHSGTFITT